MNETICRGCGREFSGGEQFCPDDGSRLASPAAVGERKPGESLIGMTLDGRYRILRVIGEGGMGVVYAAEHVLIEKQVAIKVLRETFTSRPDVVERFRQEAKSASKIGHPNIVDVSDFGETPSGQSYIVMEMLTGEDLADMLARERMLSPSRAVRIVYQVARALHATHKKNIVHRDLKPENIYLIERDGAVDIVKVVDFGVAKMSDLETPVGRRLTRTGMIFGTPEYMSPEQALGKAFDHRVDIYALGAIFFELITGRVPFEGENFMEILAKHGSSRVPTLLEANPQTQVSEQLERVVMRALCKDPAQRYQSMGELASELRATPEMPSVAPGDALEPPAWALADATPSGGTAVATVATGSAAPPPLPHRNRSTVAISDGELIPLDEGDPLLAEPLVSMGLAEVVSAVPAAALHSSVERVVPERARRSRSARPTARTRTRNTTGRVGLFGLQGNRVLWLAALATSVGLVAGNVWKRFEDPDATLSSLPPTAAVDTSPIETSQAALKSEALHVDLVDLANKAPAVVSELPNPKASEPSEVAALPSFVQVHVRTHPVGASVRAVETGAHCRAAPCALEVPRGQPVTLRAETGSGSVERTLTFDNRTEVELRVGSNARPAGTSTKAGPKLAASTNTSSKPTSSDLKVPAMFREP
jgi:serine/threonine protein kinase